jgi:hypothetical protein
VATGDVLIQVGSIITLDQAGTSYTMSFAPSGTGIASGAGRLSARVDLGAFPRAPLLAWRLTVKPTSTPTTGRVGRLWIFAAKNSTGAAGTDGYHTESDQAVSDEDRFRGGSVLRGQPADEGTVFVNSGVIAMPLARYAQFGFWNDFGVALSSTSTDHLLELWPAYDQIQS